MKQQIIDLLGSGVQSAVVADVVGCDPSYVSQIADECREEIAALRSVATAQFIDRDKLLEKAESEALQRVAGMIGFITKPMEAVRVYGVLNAAKRSLQAATSQQQQPATVVNVNISVAATPHIVKSADNQIIEVDGRSMVPMQAKQVEGMLKARRAQQLLATKVPASLVERM